MVDKSTTIPNRRYVWAVGVKEARTLVGAALVKEGLVPTKALLPPLDVKWTGVTRPLGYDYEGNAADGYKDSPNNTVRRYAVDVRA